MLTVGRNTIFDKYILKCIQEHTKVKNHYDDNGNGKYINAH